MIKDYLTIPIDQNLFERLDLLVAEIRCASRNCAVREAVEEGLSHLKHNRLAREVAEFDRRIEQMLADLLNDPTCEWSKLK